MSNGVALSAKKDHPNTATEGAKPVSIDQQTKEKALQEKQREAAIARGEILTAEQRLEALKTLSGNTSGFQLPQGKARISQTKSSGHYHVELWKRDTRITETAHTIEYDSDGSFIAMHRTIATLLRHPPGPVKFTPKESDTGISAQKLGDKLIKEALKRIPPSPN